MHIKDIADILIMTLLVYQLYFWFRKTRALQVVLGLGSLVLLYIVTKNLGLFMTSWVLQELGTVIFIVIIVIFQGEIRQALYRFSLLRNFFDKNDAAGSFDIPGIVATVFSLAERRTGALIVFERKEKLDDYLLHGVAIDALVNSQLLASIFENGGPLHDGAVIIKNARISEASSHLPLSQSSELPQYLGTRHRAALGLTEKTDALVLVVSEERGEISYAVAGELKIIKTRAELTALLKSSAVAASPALPKATLQQRFGKNLIPKFVTLLLVLLCWVLINARQGGVQTVTAQVKFHDLPGNLMLKHDLPAELNVQLKVLSNLLTSANKFEIAADIDLSKIHEGTNNITVDEKAFELPLGVSVEKISPAVITVTAEKKLYRDLPVHLKRTGRLPKGLKLRSISLEPTRVRVIGSESALARLRHIETESLDLAGVTRDLTVDVKLLAPAAEVQFGADESVSVKIVVSR
jgi:uncharacterized protein (TIGR00159 family)